MPIFGADVMVCWLLYQQIALPNRHAGAGDLTHLLARSAGENLSHSILDAHFGTTRVVGGSVSGGDAWSTGVIDLCDPAKHSLARRYSYWGGAVRFMSQLVGTLAICRCRT